MAAIGFLDSSILPNAYTHVAVAQMLCSAAISQTVRQLSDGKGSGPLLWIDLWMNER